MESEVVKWAKTQLSPSLGREKIIDLILLQTKRRNEEQKDREKVKRDREKRAPKVLSRISRLPGPKDVLLKRACAEHIAERNEFVAVTTENTTAYNKNISDSCKMTRALR